MTDEGHIKILGESSEALEKYAVRQKFGGANLVNASLIHADFAGVDLVEANLTGAYIFEADLTDANLTGANLTGTNLSGTNLTGANLAGSYLMGTNLTGTGLTRAQLTDARLYETIFADVDLSKCIGLNTCQHDGPSTIDFRTLQRSGPLPLSFLRGVGLPDSLIDYLPSLLNQAIQLYSCFISYSAKDDEFVRRLHADLQDRGVRCWFAPEDMKIGAKILDTLDQAIRLRDKVVLVLSEASIASDWVEDEVTKTFAEERQRKDAILMPVRIDDAVFETGEAWAVKLRDNRNIGNFRGWKDHDTYKKAVDRLIRDLKVEAEAG